MRLVCARDNWGVTMRGEMRHTFAMTLVRDLELVWLVAQVGFNTIR